MIQVVGSLSASRAFQPRRSGHRPSQAGNNNNDTEASEARTNIYCYYMQNKGQKVDLTPIFQTPRAGVSPDLS